MRKYAAAKNNSKYDPKGIENVKCWLLQKSAKSIGMLY